MILRYIRTMCFLFCFTCCVGFYPIVTEEVCVLEYKGYFVTLVVENNLYQLSVCRRLVANVLEYIPDVWWRNVKTVRFSSKERMSHFGVNAAMACFDRGKKMVVYFDDLTNVNPESFFEAIIHEYAHSVDPDYDLWDKTAHWELIYFMWKKGVLKTMPIEISEKLKDEMCEYWAEMAEDCLQKPLVTKKNDPDRYSYFIKRLAILAPLFDPCLNYMRVRKEFNNSVRAQLLKTNVWGRIISVEKRHLVLRNGRGLMRIANRLYAYPDVFAVSGMPMNLKEFSFVISGCRWAFISLKPRVGDTLLILEKKYLLTEPYSEARKLEHRINCNACAKKGK